MDDSPGRKAEQDGIAEQELRSRYWQWLTDRTEPGAVKALGKINANGGETSFGR